ncbi:Pectate lyase superfamily protein [Roseovarius lutimaris]|uniref:Pectate lyase superfamily protein n=1 Tax=Roseovarius lutimaris TaxID=1005928 RepID=A0A1I5G290_9RHOB|nr:glycosyl hydrolase family 28-related protein [Roseovarius lutimaris]SFO30137.1 Pectate lyase superfamily protein [Roseovarius lutimaris]
MNKAITDGIVFMPQPFAAGLDQWSSGNGTPQSDTYANAVNAAFVPADQDFGGALELQKVDAVQRLRYMGETPILPGCYLQVRARVKAISGNLPNVRIAAWAGGAGGVAVTGVTLTGPQVTLTTYGDVVEVTAIVGTGARNGVNMAWGTQALFGHFGLDLSGPSGGVVRIDDIVIEDVSRFFLRDIVSAVDVRDFGAVGDGVRDDHAAFEAADAAANGREIIVPAGTYFLGQSTTIQNRVRFEGTLEMADSSILALTKNFDLPAYIDAFEESELAFKKAYQALLNNAGHVTLDLGGRKVALRAPVDMAAAVNNKTTYKQRHVIENGQFSVFPGAAWETDVATSQATYDPRNSKRLVNVENVANIPVGSVITGNGVGREVYVTDRNIAAQRLDISQPLFDAAGTQVFTFRRFKYMLDFSGFEQISRMVMSEIEFQCSGDCSAILLPPTGTGFHLRDCFITRPKDRGVSSHGEGDQGMMIDRCQFLSDESPLLSTERVSIGFNANANDIKVRDNRVVHFRHFGVIGGSSSIISGNHVFQGDSALNGIRTSGFVLTRTNNRGTINGNYIDNCFIEWGNEHDQAPGFSGEFSFSALSITDNVFLASDVAPWFTFILVKPHGAGHFLNGVSVNGNSFRGIGGTIDRVETVDTSLADLDYNRIRNVTFDDNAFHNIQTPAASPLVMEHTEASAASTWVVEPAPRLPFGAWAQVVESVVAAGPLRSSANAVQYVTPYYQANQGADNDQINLRWPLAVSGSVILKVRIDDPL